MAAAMDLYKIFTTIFRTIELTYHSVDPSLLEQVRGLQARRK
jgi:hypothetical protein